MSNRHRNILNHNRLALRVLAQTGHRAAERHTRALAMARVSATAGISVLLLLFVASAASASTLEEFTGTASVPKQPQPLQALSSSTSALQQQAKALGAVLGRVLPAAWSPTKLQPSIAAAAAGME